MKLIANPLVLLGLTLSAFHAGAASALETCAQQGTGVIVETERGSPSLLTCLLGEPTKKVRLFRDTQTISQEILFRDGKAAEMKVFDVAGKWTAANRFTHLRNGHVIKESFLVENGQLGALKEKEELEGFDPENSDVQPNVFTAKRWFYSKTDPSELEFIALYNKQSPKRIAIKEYYSRSGEFVSRIVFTYKDNEEKPVRFVEYDSKGTVLSQLSLYEPFHPKARLQKEGLSETEIQRRLDHQKNPNRFLMGVIDGGFDYNHPELSWKWWNNPLDPVDGIDNDGNGWIDDQFGWEREKNSHLPTESSSSMAAFTRPDSHGTHVSHIATRGLENVALVGFAGDYTKAPYVDQISSFIQKHHVKVVNISIGLPHDNKNDLGLRDGNKAFERMIRANPETLFVVAAGNAGQDIDLPANRQYPASFTHANVLKVGSADTNELEPSRLHSYSISSWSNFGKRNVDLLAPGAKISAARLGGGLVVHSGTSMASPYMAHEAARLWMLYPKLTATQVREVFIQSAAKTKDHEKILSGGVVDFDAAVRLAKERTK